MTDLSTTPSAEEESFQSSTPESTFEFGRKFASSLKAGDLVLLYGGLGAGKTLFVKGVMGGLGYDVDEVTSPSFAFVNLYRTETFDVYHIDLWRIEQGGKAADAVGLSEILEEPNSVTLIEWAERLGETSFANRTITVDLAGDGDDPRKITVRMPKDSPEPI